MNDLEAYFTKNTERRIQKWKHYFEIYERHLSRFRNTPVHMIEFGVSQGGSLRMWKDYFGPECRIYGVDINPHCKHLEEDGIRIFIGGQEDRQFLRSLRDKIPRIDILIDDGGHTMNQQKTTFEELFPSIDKDGVYLCEDLHTSYWPQFGGGCGKRGTFIEYSKQFIDSLNAWHSESGKLEVTDFTRTAHSLHYYDSMLVIEKRRLEKPVCLSTGAPVIPGLPAQRTLSARIGGRIKREIARLTGGSS